MYNNCNHFSEEFLKYFTECPETISNDIKEFNRTGLAKTAKYCIAGVTVSIRALCGGLVGAQLGGLLFRGGDRFSATSIVICTGVTSIVAVKQAVPNLKYITADHH